MYQQGDICSTVSSFEAALLACDTLKAMRTVLKSSFDQFDHLTII